jgi:hypothetical protein
MIMHDDDDDDHSHLDRCLSETTVVVGLWQVDTILQLDTSRVTPMTECLRRRDTPNPPWRNRNGWSPRLREKPTGPKVESSATPFQTVSSVARRGERSSGRRRETTLHREGSRRLPSPPCYRASFPPTCVVIQSPDDKTTRY